MAKNSKKIDYFSFFNVEKCLEISDTSVILLVSFNLWEENSGRPKESILKISKISDYNKSEGENQKLASKLHPSFVQMYHYKNTENSCFFFLEYCKCLSLKKFIQSCQTKTKIFSLNNTNFAYTLKSIIKSIKVLHSANIVHRDIKLDNIFITFENYLKLGDFGSSKLVNDDRYHTVIHSEGYQSPQISDKNNTSNPFKNDIWAFGALFFNFLMQSKVNLDGRTQQEINGLIMSLKVDDDLKDILRECLKFNESERKTSSQIYDLLKSYCYQIYKQAPQEITEKEYYKQKKFNFQSNKTVTKNLNELKVGPVSKNRCVVCKESHKPIIFYRQFHRVHPKCLFIKVLNSINLHRCVICNIYDPSHMAEDYFKSLDTNQLIFRTCKDKFPNLDPKLASPKCSHFFTALNENFQSIVYKCLRLKEYFCSLCSNSESHIHCVGYLKHLKNYEKKYILSRKNNEKVVLKKYKLVYWQKEESEPEFREFQVMKKFSSNESEISRIHIHEFLSSISDDFVKVDFWYEKSGENKKIFAFYEYLNGKTLMHEVSYRKNNGIGFSLEEIELFNSFMNRVLETIHKYYIYHNFINLEGIYINVNPQGKIEKFKLGNFRNSEIFGGKQQKYENIDKKCFENCLNKLRVENLQPILRDT